MGQDVNLRWIYVRMIEEYARHSGATLGWLSRSSRWTWLEVAGWKTDFTIAFSDIAERNSQDLWIGVSRSSSRPPCRRSR